MKHVHQNEFRSQDASNDDKSYSFDQAANVENAPYHNVPSTNHTSVTLCPDVTRRNSDHCTNDSSCPSSETRIDLNFLSKGLHLCNLNVRHLMPQIDELRIVMATDKCPDIFGMCETFLEPNVPDGQVNLEGYDFLRKDRAEVQSKTGGGLILYFRNSLNVKRRLEIEISNIETIWAEITLPNAKPFLVCTTYRPPSSQTAWIDLFEEELSAAQASGLEIILMGDFNIDYVSCTNRKWLNLIQLCDLSQLVLEPTRVTQSTATTIDHVYTTNAENITECFISHFSISDHFPVCFTRKVNCKIPKSSHITTSYRCFKNFDDSLFLNDLANDISVFTTNCSSIDEDFANWYPIIMNQLDNHAPMRVKSKRLPDWFTPKIIHMQKLRDNSKRLKQWSDYKRYRNKTKYLIRQAKRKYFSDSVTNSKDSKIIWNHLRAVNTKTQASLNKLPSELKINDETITDSEVIATELNAYFCSIAQILNEHNDEVSTFESDKLSNCVNSKVPENIYFHIPLITSEQVLSFINKLDSSKATGIDGLGPRVIQIAADVLSPSIAMLINKSLLTGTFPSQMKLAKVFPIHKGGDKNDPSNYRPISILPTVSKYLKNMSISI